MTCTFTRLVVWTVREWFASDRSLRALARLELAWTERDLAAAWPRLALFLSILDFERQRELEVRSPDTVSPDRLTGDEAAVVAALACARWSTPDAALCLGGFLDADSANAAARTAARLRAATAAPAAYDVGPASRSRLAASLALDAAAHLPGVRSTVPACSSSST